MNSLKVNETKPVILSYSCKDKNTEIYNDTYHYYVGVVIGVRDCDSTTLFVISFWVIETNFYCEGGDKNPLTLRMFFKFSLILLWYIKRKTEVLFILVGGWGLGTEFF